MRIRLAIISVLAALSFLILPAAALGWANGPNGGNGFGTHDWILAQADRLAASKGAGWVNLKVALPHTDDPDTVFHDFYYHVYERWNGHNYGNAPVKVAAWYAKALAARKAKNWQAASVDVGILSHYLADLCQPMHTDQTALENTVHARYEDVVDNITTSASAVKSWAQFDGYQAPGNVQSFAVGVASASHKDYHVLVTDFAAGGWTNATVQAITRRSLNRAANTLADLIIALDKAAPGGSSSSGGGGSSSTQTLAKVVATVSNARPAQQTSVSAYAKCTDAAGRAISGASATFTWHYKTTTPVASCASNSSGVATCTRSIGRASIGYFVSITIKVTYRGVTKTASTGFTPR
jgi:hypothetical protein